MSTENVVPISNEVLCPICGTCMWLKDPGYYGCKHSHVMAADAILAPADPKKRLVVVQPQEHWPWWRKAEIPWLIAAVLLVIQIVEALL